MRIKATISYNGAMFLGFQRQKNCSNTVAQTFEKALKSVGIEGKIYGSGRTDRGVHATGQVIHFDIPSFWEKKGLESLKYQLNSKLSSIKIKYLKEVEPTFHAQYSATNRIYRYIIKLSEASVFEEEFVSTYELEHLELMEQALELYVGQHDFSFFKKEGSPTSSNIRTIRRVDTVKLKKYFIIYFHADGYLRSQVRMMVEGALKVSKGELTLKQLQRQIDVKERFFTTLAKPQGLYLHRVTY